VPDERRPSLLSFAPLIIGVTVLPIWRAAVRNLMLECLDPVIMLLGRFVSPTSLEVAHDAGQLGRRRLSPTRSPRAPNGDITLLVGLFSFPSQRPAVNVRRLALHARQGDNRNPELANESRRCREERRNNQNQNQNQNNNCPQHRRLARPHSGRCSGIAW